MNPLQPLMSLLAQTESERDQAWGEAQRAMHAHQNASAQVDQLLVYRREYEQRWAAQLKTESRIELMHCYRGFMDRLTQAVEQQERVCTYAATQAERTREALAEHEMRVAAVRKLIERRAQELRQSADRQEQKQMDEFSSRMTWGNAASPTSMGLPRAA